MDISKIKEEFFRIAKSEYPEKRDVFDILWNNVSLWVETAEKEASGKSESKRLEQMRKISVSLRAQSESNTLRGIHNLLAEVKGFLEDVPDTEKQ